MASGKKRSSPGSSKTRSYYTVLTTAALALLLFSQPAKAADDDVVQSSARQIEKICGKLSEILAAKTSIPLPVAKVRMGKMHLPYPNSCKSRFSYGFGWTCLPGVDMILTEVPVGLDVGVKNVRIDRFVKQAVPGLDAIAQRGPEFCKLIPQAMKFVDLDAVKALLEGDIGEASAEVLQMYGELQQQVVDTLLKIKNNKAELTRNKGALVQNDNVRIFRAAEIDLARYTSFVGALAPCFTPAGCQIEAIRGFFEVWLKDSEETMSDQVKAVLMPWSNGIDTVSKQFADLEKTSAALAAQGKNVKDQVDRLVASLCQDADACVEETYDLLKEHVERTFDLSDQLAQVQSTFAGAVSDVQGVVDIISGAVAAFDSLSDLGIDAIITKATNGELKGIEDVTDGLKAVQRLPDIVNSLQDRLPELQKIYEEVAERGPSFFSQLQALLVDAWVENLPQAQSSSTRARNGVIEIQNLLVTLAPQANQIAESVALLAGTFSSVTSTGRIGRVDAGVASYQNWISGWFAMPCLTTGKIRLEIPGTTFWTSVPYPKFYRCKQGYHIAFPNYHVPYVKLTMPKDSTLARFGRGERRSFTTISYDGAPRSESTTARSSSTASDTSSRPSTTPEVPPSTTPAPTPSPETPDEPSTAPQPGNTSPEVSEPTPTAVRFRVRKSVEIRQDAGTEGEDEAGEAEIPPDPTYGLTVSELVNAATVTQAQVAAASAAEPTALFYETTINGQVTTLQTPIPAGATVVSTETVPDPTTERTASVTQTELDPFADLPVETALPTMSMEEYGTAGVVTSMPPAATGSTNGETGSANRAMLAQITLSLGVSLALWLILAM